MHSGYRKINYSTPGFVLPIILAGLGILGGISAAFLTWISLELKSIKSEKLYLQEEIWVDYLKAFQFEMYEKFQTTDLCFVLQEGEGSGAAFKIFDSEEAPVAFLGAWRLLKNDKIYTADWELKPFSSFPKDKIFFSKLIINDDAVDLSQLRSKEIIQGTLWKDDHGSTGPLWQVAQDFFHNQSLKLRPYEITPPHVPIALSLQDWMRSPLSLPDQHVADQRVDPVCSACAPCIESFNWTAEIEVQEHLTDHGVLFNYYLILKPIITLYNPYEFSLEGARYHLTWNTFGNSIFAESQLYDGYAWLPKDQYNVSTYMNKNSHTFSDIFQFLPGEKKLWHLPLMKWPIGPRVSSGHHLIIKDLKNPPLLQNLRLELEQNNQKFTIQFKDEINFSSANALSMKWISGGEKPVFQNPIFTHQWFTPVELLNFDTVQKLTNPCALKSVRWNPLAPITLGYISPAHHLSEAEKEWVVRLNSALWDNSYNSASPHLFLKNKKFFTKRPFWIATQEAQEWEAFLNDLDLGLSFQEIKKWSTIWATQVKKILESNDLKYVSQLVYSKGLPDFNPIWEAMPRGLSFEMFWEKAWLRLNTCPSHFTLSLSKIQGENKKRLQALDIKTKL